MSLQSIDFAPDGTEVRAVGVVLTTGLYAAPQLNELGSGLAFAAASDGSFWSAQSENFGQPGIFLFDASTGMLNSVSNVETPGSSPVANCLAPVNCSRAFFVTSTQSIARVDVTGSDGTTTNLAVLPGGAVPTGVSCSPDGTLWTTTSSGAIYSYNPTDDTWTTVPIPPAAPLTVSVGNSSFAIALAKQSGSTTLYTYSKGTWTAANTFCPKDATWVGACVDGSYWVADPTELTLVLPDASKVSFPLPAVVYGFTAASRFGCYFVALSPTLGIKLAGYGVTEQPAQDWPKMTPEQNDAYVALSTQLGISDPASVRAAYANFDVSLSDYFTIVYNMPCPEGVADADWNIVKPQILTELQYAQDVQKLFTNIVTLNNEISEIQLAEYDAVVKMVGLPDNPDQQPQDKASIILNAVVSKLFSAAVSIAPPKVKALVSVVNSIYNFAASQQAKKHNIANADVALTIACAKLSGTIADMQTDALKAAADFETAILSDWGMLEACGLAIKSNFWDWPPSFDTDVLKPAAAANALTFYQTLMPVKYRLMQVWIAAGSGVPSSYLALTNAPAYAVLGQVQIKSSGSNAWWQVITEKDAVAGQDMTGPFPNQALVETVIGLSDAQSLFTNAKGWNFEFVPMGGSTPSPPSSVQFKTWVNSPNPINL